MKLALLAVAWLAGAFIELRFDASWLPVLLLLLAALTGLALLRLYRLSLWPMILTGVLLLAVFRVAAGDDTPVPLAEEDGQSVTLAGRITDAPEAGGRRIKFLLAAETLDRGRGPEAFSGKVLVYAEPPASLAFSREPPYFRYGDSLQLVGETQLPSFLAGFDYASYLSNQGISGVLFPRQVTVVGPPPDAGRGWRGHIFDLRGRLSRNLEDALPRPQSSLAQALLLGQRGGLPDDLVEDFRSTGTSHLLAISGLHVGVLLLISVGVAGAVFGRHRPYYLVISFLAIWFYAIISGMSPSVVRAAIMGTVYLAALVTGRPNSALPALAFSAAAMVAHSPQLLHQVSFQLSFAAMAGIILALPYQARVALFCGRWSAANGRPWLGPALTWAATAVIVSTAATLATWPLVALNFDRLPLLGIFATIVVLPALPFVLLGALAVALGGLMHPGVGEVLGWLTWLPISYITNLISWFPGTTITGSWVSPPLVWSYYIALGGLLLLLGSGPRLARFLGPLSWFARQPKIVGSGSYAGSISAFAICLFGLILLIATVVVWTRVLSGTDGKLHVYFFDVGQGDSALIVTPGGKQVLVDGGPESDSGTRALSGPLSENDRSLDLIVSTHLDADHSRGLIRVLEDYKVETVAVGLEDPESPMYPRWQAEINRGSADKVRVASGYRFLLEPGLVLEVLNPSADANGGSRESDNNSGVVIRLSYGNISFLLAADIEAEAEFRLARQPGKLESSVLKVAHHGSRTSTTPVFLRAVNPSYAVVSVGSENPFGHPSQEVIQRLDEALGAGAIYRTDRDGTVEFISDGETLWVRTEN